jgi:hypothetical protein
MHTQTAHSRVLGGAMMFRLQALWGFINIVWKHEVCVRSGSCTLKYGHMACLHGPTQHLHFPLHPDWTTPPPRTRLHHYMFVFFKGFMVNVGVNAWAGYMSSLTQLPVVCTPATSLGLIA